MSLFDYTHALCREPAPSVVKGIRHGDGPDPDFHELLAEHQAYVAALRGLGLEVTVLPPEAAFPDSVFVEDPALVFTQGAILLNMAAPARAGEAALLAPALEDRFERVLRMAGPGHADGGDVLVLPDNVVIGLSARTDRAGAEELAALLRQLGKQALVAETPPGVLHFKTGCSLIDEETIFALPAMKDSPAFAGLNVLTVPEGETGAANKLRIRGKLLINKAYEKSRALIEAHGVATIPLAATQIARIDAGLSCMSLRWQSR
jgi:dimethylargininase